MQRIIGESSTLAEALGQVSQLAPLNRPVLVVGERGSGKELIAERLHYLSPRWQNPLHKVNCAAISEALLDSELFGHEAGAFTGASKRHIGRFERADGGSLFLDELATMPLRIQEKLLRLIEYGEFERLGGQQTLKVDIRIIAATNADLPQRVAQTSFRADLLDRLAFDVVQVPPLRRRGEDIPTLVDYFAVKMSHELGWQYYSGFTPEALASLLAHSWPGNVRELKNVVERSVCRWGESDAPIAEVIIDPFAAAAATATEPSAAREPAVATLNFAAEVKQLELKLLRTALGACHYRQKDAAALLQLSYHQLRALLRKYKGELP